MGIQFLSHEDTRNRLNGTICMYNDLPVYVTSTGERNLVQIQPLRTKTDSASIKTVDVGDPNFSYKSVPLGYISYQTHALYVMRIPYRQVKAGLSPECIACEPAYDSNQFFMSKAMEDCILGRHVDLPTALKKITTRKANSVSIHRHVAIGQLGDVRTSLLYRGRVVGVWDEHNNRFSLNDGPDYSFIYRILNNLGLPGV